MGSSFISDEVSQEFSDGPEQRTLVVTWLDDFGQLGVNQQQQGQQMVLSWGLQFAVFSIGGAGMRLSADSGYPMFGPGEQMLYV